MKENWVYRRGDLYLANLGVPVGSKQGGVRPVVVLQNDVGNYYAPTITIAPLTSKIEKKRKQPTHFFLRKAKGLAKPSMVLIFAQASRAKTKSMVLRLFCKLFVNPIDKAGGQEYIFSSRADRVLKVKRTAP